MGCVGAVNQLDDWWAPYLATSFGIFGVVAVAVWFCGVGCVAVASVTFVGSLAGSLAMVFSTSLVCVRMVGVVGTQQEEHKHMSLLDILGCVSFNQQRYLEKNFSPLSGCGGSVFGKGSFDVPADRASSLTYCSSEWLK